MGKLKDLYGSFFNPKPIPKQPPGPGKSLVDKIKERKKKQKALLDKLGK